MSKRTLLPLLVICILPAAAHADGLAARADRRRTFAERDDRRWELRYPVGAYQPTDGVIGRIRGPLGTTVELLVSRHGVDQPFRVRLERAEIKLAFVKWSLLQRDDEHQLHFVGLQRFSTESWRAGFVQLEFAAIERRNGSARTRTASES